MTKAVAKEENTVAPVSQLLKVARAKEIMVAFTLHKTYRKGCHSNRTYLQPVHVNSERL